MRLDDTEKLIIKMLREGLTQPQIAYKLKEKGIKPYSLSSVEKRIKGLKDVCGAKTIFHLAVILIEKKSKIWKL